MGGAVVEVVPGIEVEVLSAAASVESPSAAGAVVAGEVGGGSGGEAGTTGAVARCDAPTPGAATNMGSTVAIATVHRRNEWRGVMVLRGGLSPIGPPPALLSARHNVRVTDDEVIGQLGSVVGDHHVLVDELTEGFRTDWTARWLGAPMCVVRPGSSAEVAEVVRVCAEHRVAVVPQGGNTGLVGGTCAPEGSILLSLGRLDTVGEPDVDRGRLEVQAGATLADVHGRLVGTGWRYPIDFGARDSATIGGTIATNAGGVHVLRFGSTRSLVAGLQWVAADGSVISRLHALDKDNTGYDLVSMIVGSEGTLGVVTAAMLRLVAEPTELVTVLVAFDSLPEALEAAWIIRRHDPNVEVVEVIDGPCLDLVSSFRRISIPTGPCGAALLVESAADVDPAPGLAAALGRCDGVGEVAVASRRTEREHLWLFRDEITTALAGMGDVAKFDVSLPPAALATFCDRVRTTTMALTTRPSVWLFGHVCDGNLHVNITGVGPEVAALDQLVYSEVSASGGSISAEHGIGRAKTGWLHLSRSPEEVASMRAIKRALDPLGILNPGAIFTR